jgi:hypothetical protein
MAVETPVYNHDIMGLIRRLNRFMKEVIESSSAGISGMGVADLDRLKAYQTALMEYKTWVVGQPQLDLPKTHPSAHTIPDPPDQNSIDSEILIDVVTLWSKMRIELLASQSAQLATGLISPDATRFDAIWGKIQAFIADYIEPITPLDVPESSPGNG